MDPLHAAGVTRRERDILLLVADRLHNQEIADRLHLSVRTVESHVSALLRKLGGTTRQSLVDAVARMPDRAAALPTPVSSFVGRERELSDLLRLVHEHRVVTLTGPAGSGKTRLALRIAGTDTELPPPVLVDLAAVPPGAPVLRAMADALGVTGDDQRLRATLRDVVAGAAHWLLVDNCEHVTDATATLLAGLLTSAPGLRVLATSHGPLRLAGEVTYEIGPLEWPPDTDEPDTVLAAPAARLFTDRATAALPGFTVTEANARAVATVCRRLDGLPLAIELAAARIRLFSPTELATRLDDRFALLTDGPHGVPSRHRALAEALDWSYQLLTEDERVLFERCAVFPGDFDYDTATQVLTAPPLTEPDLARLFPRLLDRSLITSRRREESTQYRMLDSVRQFAAGRLAERGCLTTLRAQHADRHFQQAIALHDALRGGDQPGALAWFDRRWPDLRAAMHTAFSTDQHEAAWKFLAGVGLGWEVIGARGELFDWLDRLLAGSLPTGPLGIRAAATAAVLWCYQDIRRARELAAQAVNRSTPGTTERNLATLALGWALAYDTDPTPARDLLAEVIEQDPDPWHVALAHSCRGQTAPNLTTAITDYEQAIEALTRLGDQVIRANCRNKMAIKAIQSGTRLNEAATWLTEAQQLANTAGNQHEWLHAEVYRAYLDQTAGDHQTATARFKTTLPKFRRIGDLRCVKRCLTGLSRSATHTGDHDTAQRYLTESAALSTELGETPVPRF